MGGEEELLLGLAMMCQDCVGINNTRGRHSSATAENGYWGMRSQDGWTVNGISSIMGGSCPAWPECRAGMEAAAGKVIGWGTASRQPRECRRQPPLPSTAASIGWGDHREEAGAFCECPRQPRLLLLGRLLSWAVGGTEDRAGRPSAVGLARSGG